MTAEATITLRPPAYVLGESEHRLADAEEVLPAVREALADAGVDRYWTTAREPWRLAADAVRLSLAEAEVDPADIDVLLYATNSFWDPDFPTNATASALMQEVGLTRAFPVGIHLARCANTQVGLRHAAALIACGQAERVVFVCVDKAEPGTDRLVSPKISVRTDAAASVLITAADGKGGFAVVDTVLTMDPTLGLIDPEVQFSEYLSGVTSGLIATVEDLLARSEAEVVDIDALLPNNYNRWITRSMAKLGGFSDEQIYLDNVGRVAHAVAADNLINLRDYTDSRGPAAGDLLLMLASGPSQWGATLLRRLEVAA